MSYNGKLYAWSQIQGIGIVKDSPMKEIAYKFIDWLLSNEIQAMVAANDIMLPANTWALENLPGDVKFALGYNLSEIEYLNKYISPAEIYNKISQWLDQWNNIFSSFTYTFNSQFFNLQNLGKTVFELGVQTEKI